jgi:hypothetical protein
MFGTAIAFAITPLLCPLTGQAQVWQVLGKAVRAWFP